MELQNITSRYASEPATAQAILMEDWDAVLVLSDLIAEDINAQPLAAIIKAWALVAKGQGRSRVIVSHPIKQREHIRRATNLPSAVFTMQAARMANYLGDTGEMLKLADQLFNVMTYHHSLCFSLPPFMRDTKKTVSLNN